jgi:hypothetical protein
MQEQDRQKIERTLLKHSQRFSASLTKPAYPAPSLFRLMAFRMGRTSMQQMLDNESHDYAYYMEQGWFASDDYYPVRLGLLKKLAGKTFDWLAQVMT